MEFLAEGYLTPVGPHWVFPEIFYPRWTPLKGLGIPPWVRGKGFNFLPQNFLGYPNLRGPNRKGSGFNRKGPRKKGRLGPHFRATQGGRIGNSPFSQKAHYWAPVGALGEVYPRLGLVGAPTRGESPVVSRTEVVSTFHFFGGRCPRRNRVFRGFSPWKVRGAYLAGLWGKTWCPFLRKS